MNSVNKTLYIPLYGKSYVSKKGIILKDKRAEEIWETEGFPLGGKSRSKYLAYYMGIRSAVFDEWTRARLRLDPEAVVIHIGCGLDSRVLRVGASAHKWYDLDFPAVIEERKRYYKETDNYKMIPADAKNTEWLEQVKERDSAIVIMEGVSMYLSAEEMRNTLQGICGKFRDFGLLVDCYTTFGARMSSRRNPINDVGVTSAYGIDDPMEYLCPGLSFVKEHTMIPEKYIDELRGLERFIFARLYAGGISKRIYRLFEYKGQLYR